MTEPCEHHTVSDKPEDQPCYPRTAALLQEEEIQRLQAKVNVLEADNAALKSKLAQYEEGRPMSEAPRDGTSILLRHVDGYYIPATRESDCELWCSYDGYYGDEEFESWWPLPGGAK